MGSNNGTFVNDECVVEPRSFQSGDEIKLGEDLLMMIEVVESQYVGLKSSGAHGEKNGNPLPLPDTMVLGDDITSMKRAARHFLQDFQV